MLDALMRGDVEMMPAFLADHLQRFEFLVENVGAAFRAFRPQPLRHFLFFRRRLAVVGLREKAAGRSKVVGHGFVGREDLTPGNGQDGQLARPGLGQSLSAGVDRRTRRNNIVY